MTISEDEVYRLTQKHLPRIWECITEAFEMYQSDPNRLVHRRSTRANILNDYIISNVINTFDQVPNVRMGEDRKRHLRVLVVEERVCLWFKKVSSWRQTANYPTSHAINLLMGRQLEMFPAKPIIVVGYLLNRDESSILRVSFAPPALIKPKWYFDIFTVAENIQALPGLRAVQRERTQLVVQRGARQIPLLGTDN